MHCVYDILLSHFSFIFCTCFFPSYNCIAGNLGMKKTSVLKVILHKLYVVLQIKLAKKYWRLSIFISQFAPERICFLIAEHIVNRELDGYAEDLCIWLWS